MSPESIKIAILKVLSASTRVLTFRLQCLAVMCLLLCGAPSIASAQTRITWSPRKIVEEVTQGTQKTVSATFTSSQNLSDVILRIPPVLQPYVVAEPSSFSFIQAGDVVPVTLTLSAPSNANLGSIQGALRLRTAQRPRIAYVRRLPVVLTIGAAPPPPPPVWVEQGPGPITNGQTEGLPNNPVAGAINAIAASPTNPDLVFVGTVNGGIWKTMNGTSSSPAWTTTTDLQLPALSIRSLAMSPVNENILFAGTGSTSSFSFVGSPGFGVVRSTDGGETWSVLSTTTFAGRRISSIVPTTLDGGNMVLASTQFDTFGGGGVFRSTDLGESFTRLSGDPASGLPNAFVSSLAGDPGNADRFYAGVPSFSGSAGREGVYRSDDGGLTWIQVNAGLTGLSTSVRILLSVHSNANLHTNAVYAVILTTTTPNLAGVFRSDDGGESWSDLGVPNPQAFPGSQEVLHGAMIADPNDPNVVFVSGDRQATPFPNANGCHNFTGNTFRADAALPLELRWTSVDCNGAHGTSPHADSRAMAFDANGDLLQANDGGIYRLADPNNLAGARQWFSANGDIRTTELHSVSYDPLSRVLFGGTQDVGTPVQTRSNTFTWSELIQGDGGKVAVDADQTAHPGTTIRYASSQGLGSFSRTMWDAANNRIGGFTLPQLRIVSGLGAGQTLFQFDTTIGFYQAFVLNSVDPSRMLLGTRFIYESFDRGDTLNDLVDTGALVPSGLGNPMAYGGRLDGISYPDVFYVGSGRFIVHRGALDNSITTLTSYPGATVRSLVVDPEDFLQIFVVDALNRVWASFDEGASWTDITGNLGSLTGDVRAVEIVNVDASENPILLVGGLGGVFQLLEPESGSGSWTPLGTALPHGLVTDLRYNVADDVLVAAVFGRGAWILSGFFQGSAP
jgi:hypothetical protein